MNNPISSAGLVYVYLNGYEKDSLLHIQTTDSYRHMEDAFYQQVMVNAALADEDDTRVHVFAVLGTAEKAAAVHQVIEDTLRKNFQRILDRKTIRTNSRKLDNTGNAFCKCVQEFFCEQLEHYPKRLYMDCGDFVFAGIYCSHLPDAQGNAIADAIASLWMEREEPCLCGKQLMLRSFFLRDFVGRKVIACIPHKQTGEWHLAFEGGHQLSLEDGLSYMKETIHPNDFGRFCSSNLQTILLNPIYAYGVWLQPNDLCEEWHKVFIYLCASSEHLWDKESLAAAYNRFLEFLQDNICETAEAEPIITKEAYYAVLLKHIEQFRDFLKGEDEPVISKDLHQTLNSRYVYLPYIWSFVAHKKIHSSFSPTVLHGIVNQAVCSGDTYERGTLWEDAASYMLAGITEWKITGRQIVKQVQHFQRKLHQEFSIQDTFWGGY